MIRIADLCAGIGGIHLGFEQAFGKETQSYFDTNRKLQKIEFTLVLKKSPSTTSDLIVLNNDSSSSFIDALTNLAHAGKLTEIDETTTFFWNFSCFYYILLPGFWKS